MHLPSPRKEIDFTRAAIRQIAGLGAGDRAALREALRRYADDAADRTSTTRAAPVTRFTVRAVHVSLVEGEERIVVLKIGGGESDDAFRLLRDLALGREERVSERSLERLLAGDNAIKVWREHRGLTQTVLAKRAGINAHYLSQIETGARHPSDEVMADLQHALGLDALDFGLLVDLPGRERKKSRRRQAGRL